MLLLLLLLQLLLFLLLLGYYCHTPIAPTTGTNSITFCVLCLDVLYFRKCLGSYRLQHIQVKACPTEKDLGLILVDTKDMKEELLPSPLKCLEMLYEVLPNIAKTMMDGLIQISQDAVIKLEGEPALTIDYVNVLK